MPDFRRYWGGGEGGGGNITDHKTLVTYSFIIIGARALWRTHSFSLGRLPTSATAAAMTPETIAFRSFPHKMSFDGGRRRAHLYIEHRFYFRNIYYGRVTREVPCA